MTLERKPHLLYATLDSDYGRVDYRLECPYDGHPDAPCRPWEECMEHETPTVPEGQVKGKWLPGKGFVPEEGQDPELIAAWDSYYAAEELWEAQHEESGGQGYHVAEGCWAVSFVAEGSPDDGWNFDSSMNDTLIVSPIKVDYFNEGGSFEDSYLTLAKWKEPLDGEQADDAADVRQP